MNLQNLPSGSRYGKLIKSCVEAPPGKLFVSSDFNGLEDRINTVLTKDPNKVKVFTGMRIFELNVNGTIHHIREDATINFDGKVFTGEEFYEAYCVL